MPASSPRGNITSPAKAMACIEVTIAWCMDLINSCTWWFFGGTYVDRGAFIL